MKKIKSIFIKYWYLWKIAKWIEVYDRPGDDSGKWKEMRISVTDVCPLCQNECKETIKGGFRYLIVDKRGYIYSLDIRNFFEGWGIKKVMRKGKKCVALVCKRHMRNWMDEW